MASASALVTVTVLTALDGVMRASGAALADGITMSLQFGMATCGEACVGLGGLRPDVSAAGLHPAISTANAVPQKAE